MHRIALFGYDDEGKRALEGIGLSVRPARRGSDGWRYETACKDMATIHRVAGQIAGALGDVSIRPTACLGSNRDGISGNSLPFTQASAVRRSYYAGPFTAEWIWDRRRETEYGERANRREHRLPHRLAGRRGDCQGSLLGLGTAESCDETIAEAVQVR